VTVSRALAVVGLLLSWWLPFTPSFAASEDALITEEQVIDPQVERREIHEAQIDTEDFEIGVFGGIYSVEDFGANTVAGVKLAYHVTEDFFLEAAAGLTETDRSTAEDFFNFDLLEDDERKLTYYNISLGYNFLPGESFIGSNWAFHTDFYFIGGIGFTDFAGDNHFTANVGAGYRFIVTDWMAVRFDFRDHIFDVDVQGLEERTHNLEMTAGLTFFF
jgi:outer membrane beta-barrel protein